MDIWFIVCVYKKVYIYIVDNINIKWNYHL